MVQIGGYIKKHQGKNTKDLVKPRVCELAIHVIHGENKIIQTQFTLNWTFEWKKKSYDPLSELSYKKITVIDL